MAIEIDEESRCAGCGYSLRGLSEPRCPECGMPFDPKDPTVEIPWLYRGALGRWETFWATVRLVLLKPGWFAEQARRPLYVDPVSPPRFRTVCVAIGAAAIATIVTIALWTRWADGRWMLAGLTWLATVPPAAAFLHLASVPLDLAGFESIRAQIRFRRLYHFTAAWIVLTVPALAFYVGMLVFGPATDTNLLALAMLAIPGAAWGVAITHFQVRAASRHAGWVVGHLLIIVLFWGLLGTFCGGGAVLLIGLTVGIARGG